jgi:hypothetical protein
VLLVAHVHPGDIAAADGVGDVVQGVTDHSVTPLHPCGLQRVDDDIRDLAFSHETPPHAHEQFDGYNTTTMGKTQLPPTPPCQDKRLELRDLARALIKPPEGQRTAVLLIGLEGMCYADIAASTGVPFGTVRSRLSRGCAFDRGPRRLN